MNQSEPNSTAELLVRIVGRVQGVGFRDFVVRRAPGLGVRGYVRNTEGGDVEVVAQGEQARLESLLILLRQGPAAAHVHEVHTTWREPTMHFSGFHMRW